MNSVTVKQYKKYAELMQKNSSEMLIDAMFFNLKIIQEMFGNRMSLDELGKSDIVELLTASKGIHFIMQDIVSQKFLELLGGEQVEKEASEFDEYDLENGYDEVEQQGNVWQVCSENIDRIIKIAIRLLKNSYSQCLDMEMITLLDYVKFELETVEENQGEF